MDNILQISSKLPSALRIANSRYGSLSPIQQESRASQSIFELSSRDKTLTKEKFSLPKSKALLPTLKTLETPVNQTKFKKIRKVRYDSLQIAPRTSLNKVDIKTMEQELN